MDTDFWKKNILDTICKFADDSYQKEAWFGFGDHVSSPEEMYCELFDDFLYDDFVTSPDVAITEDQRRLALQFKDLLNEYAESVDFLSVPQQVFYDNNWNKIRETAKKLIDSFNTDGSGTASVYSGPRI